MITAAELRGLVLPWCDHRDQYLDLIRQKEEYTVDEICDAWPGILKEFFGDNYQGAMEDIWHFSYRMLSYGCWEGDQPFRDQTLGKSFKEAVEILRERLHVHY